MKLSEIKTMEDVEIYEEQMRRIMAIISVPTLSIIALSFITLGVYIICARHEYFSGAFMLVSAMANLHCVYIIWRYYYSK